jgi:hypothetical protein
MENPKYRQLTLQELYGAEIFTKESIIPILPSPNLSSKAIQAVMIPSMPATLPVPMVNSVKEIKPTVRSQLLMKSEAKQIFTATNTTKLGVKMDTNVLVIAIVLLAVVSGIIYRCAKFKQTEKKSNISSKK